MSPPAFSRNGKHPSAAESTDASLLHSPLSEGERQALHTVQEFASSVRSDIGKIRELTKENWPNHPWYKTAWDPTSHCRPRKRLEVAEKIADRLAQNVHDIEREAMNRILTGGPLRAEEESVRTTQKLQAVLNQICRIKTGIAKREHPEQQQPTKGKDLEIEELPKLQ